jgi:hypothetical protein
MSFKNQRRCNMTARPFLTPEIESEIPRTLLVDHTSPPLFVNWNAEQKPFNVPLGPNGELIINVSRYRKVNILVSCTEGSIANVAEIIFGVLSSNQPLGSPVQVPLDDACDGKVQTLDIKGPEIKCNLLTSDPNAVSCLAQVYLFFTS